ncbi:undecaprenyl-diphosphatase [Carboxydothermus pertinax]|uniref:Undecaprenyl-diphosphatase n=1 Tax=Carboxydothermus pertinax TaxID=870242 RepID=A0A1L8CSJ2_9THEO|nr:undecaprenyl-diphosphatase [Carboxydothermus pertinax]GAV21883.1 undecaprenyl-diphosphatase [Carboxydothermus pertinax]
MDYTLFQVINNLSGHNIIIDRLMIAISKYGIFFYGLMLLAIFLTSQKRVKIEIFKIGFAGLIAVGLAGLISKIYYRPRPFISHKVHLLYPHQPDGSFPSDHVTGGFTLALGLYSLSPSLGRIAIVYSIIMAFSRIYVGHHYPTDVVGGILLGALINFLRLYFEKNFLSIKRRDLQC